VGQPIVSVVIPTHNRHAALLRLLRSIEAQAQELPIEVIVVDDGSSNPSAASLRSHDITLDMRVIAQPLSGAAAARNTGAAAARGELLLFLDDDVELLAGSLQAHVAFHAAAGDIALGDLPPVVIGDSFFSIRLRGWGQGMRPGIAGVGYRYNFRDLMSAHFSIRRSRFEELGGFDRAFWCHEDWELGYRAIEAGLALRYVPGAVALHYDATGVTKALRRKFDEGVADVQLTRKHPRLASELPLTWVMHSRREHALRMLAEHQPRLGDAFVAGALRLLPMWEALTLRFRWRAVLEAALTYWYWRGVATALDGQPLDVGMIDVAIDALPIVELQCGVEAAAAQLDRLQPDGVVLTLAGETFATVPARAGHEPLRGIHLRRLLAREHSTAYAQALGRAGLMPPVLASAVLDTAKPQLESRVPEPPQRESASAA
jgi:GT2 family glycosyltransferase